MMLRGRLGLERVRIPYNARHGLVWLDRGKLDVKDGCLRFVTAGGVLEAGEYEIPHQAISMVLLGPGSSVTHDALRLLASHGAALAAIGEGGVKLYTAPPLMAGSSALARRQAELWADRNSRMYVARQMYAMRFGEVLPHRDIEVLRGMEGARVKAAYARIAEEFGIEWKGRHYDRANPAAADSANQAINHVSSAVRAAAAIAVMATAAIPQLGFVHEDSSQALILDIADLYRDTTTLRIAFGAVRDAQAQDLTLERLVRRRANVIFADDDVIPSMIERIKQLLTPP
jgi:CRISPR-associated protein Cas1